MQQATTTPFQHPQPASSDAYLESTGEVIQWYLAQWNRRLRLKRTLTWLPRGLLLGVVVALSFAFVSWLQPWLLPNALIRISFVSILSSGLLTVLAVWLWPRPLNHSARDFDLRFDLKERITTALELVRGEIHALPMLRERQLEDTRIVANKLNAKYLLPLRVEWREVVILLVVFFLLVLSIVLDNPQAREIEARQALDQEIQDRVTELESARDEVQNNPNLSEAEREELTQPLDEAIDALNQDGISEEEAVASLAEAEQQLREMSEGLSAEERQANQNAGNDLSSSSLTDELGDALGDNDLGAASEETEELARDLSELSPEQLSEVADELEEAARNLQETNPELAEQLQEAADAIRNGDLEAAQQALENAAQTLAEQQAQNENSPLAEAAENAANQVAQSRETLTDNANQSSQQSSQSGQPNQQAGEQQPGNQPGQNQPGQQPGDANQSSQTGEGQPGQGDSQQGDGGGQSDQATETDSGQGEGSQTGSSQNPAESGQPGGAGAGDGASSSSDEESGAPPSGSQTGATDNRPGDDDEREFEDIFSPTRIGGEGGPEVNVDGVITGEGDQPLGETDFNEAFEGDSTVPYNQVFRDYERAMQDALDSDYIPIGVKDIIRSYFSSLEP